MLRTFPVLIDIENDENLLLLGMNTDVVIEVLNKDGICQCANNVFKD
jgi:hypothetical protein